MKELEKTPQEPIENINIKKQIQDLIKKVEEQLPDEEELKEALEKALKEDKLHLYTALNIIAHISDFELGPEEVLEAFDKNLLDQLKQRAKKAKIAQEELYPLLIKIIKKITNEDTIETL